MKKKSKDNLQKLSPGRRQYLNIKNQYQDCLLLYRMGDFYETFDEDAKILSSVLVCIYLSEFIDRLLVYNSITIINNNQIKFEFNRLFINILYINIT